VILLDLLMPDMDGFEVVEALHTEPDTASIPIVVLTSKSMSAEDKERLRGRISYVGRKAEFRVSDLAQILRRASSERQWPATEPA
jgi:CheY-like chemotaxis protein